MSLEKMKRLSKMDSQKSYKLLQMAKELARAATEVQETLENSFLREQVIEVVEGHYDLGVVREAYEVFGGYINRSFKVVVDKSGERRDYFVRKYKLGIGESEILFEHAMITHTKENGFDLAAGLIHSNEKRTFVSPDISRNKFAIYEFLEGEDKYTWDNPIMEDCEYQSAGEVLATFHSAAKDFDPANLGRVEPEIMVMMDEFKNVFQECADINRNTKFHEYYRYNLEQIFGAIDANSISKEDIAQMVRCPIHCDYHPGNLKFEDGKVVGLFDFDWAKLDRRLFDVCLSLAYNTVQWGGVDDGAMDLKKCQIFVQAYQTALRDLGTMPVLSDVELKHFPTMMAWANFYLLNWDITDYYMDDDRNDYEYLAYLKHNVRQMRWIESHKNEFAKVADSIL